MHILLRQLFYMNSQMEFYIEAAKNINKLSAELFTALKDFMYLREENPAYGKITGDVTKDDKFTIEITSREVPEWFTLI